MNKFERELARIETAKQNNLNFFNSHIISKQLYNYNRMILNGQKAKLLKELGVWKNKYFGGVKNVFMGRKCK